jgi:hypothetical protein
MLNKVKFTWDLAWELPYQGIFSFDFFDFRSRPKNEPTE